MNIGNAAEFSGLSTKTIRYYESIGLILPDRDENNHRNFSDHDIHKLTFLYRARSLGFTIQDCRNLHFLYEDRMRTSSEVKRISEEHLKSIDHKILELESMRKALGELIERCHGDHRPECPILDDISGDVLPEN